MRPGLEVGFGLFLIRCSFQCIKAAKIVDVPLSHPMRHHAAQQCFIQTKHGGKTVYAVVKGFCQLLGHIITEIHANYRYNINTLNVVQENIGILLLFLGKERKGLMQFLLRLLQFLLGSIAQ